MQSEGPVVLLRRAAHQAQAVAVARLAGPAAERRAGVAAAAGLAAADRGLALAGSAGGAVTGVDHCKADPVADQVGGQLDPRAAVLEGVGDEVVEGGGEVEPVTLDRRLPGVPAHLD